MTKNNQTHTHIYNYIYVHNYIIYNFNYIYIIIIYICIIDSLHIPGYIGDFNPVIGVRKIFQSSLTMTSRNHWDQLVIEHLHFVSIDGVLT
jgi:hypothetical protein